MNFRKNRTWRLRALTVAMLAALVATLGACAPQSSGDAGAASSGDAPASYPIGSLKAAHVNKELDGVEEYTNKLCLSCHKRDAINAASEDFAGIEGANPHRSHLEAGDCTSCHSVDGTSTLSCNSCHDIPLPEGWQSAERGAGPLHSLAK